MKRRVAPRSLTALIVAVLVASVVMPGAAVADTPDAPSPDSAVTPTPEDDQSESPAPPVPEATPTPAPTDSTPPTPSPRVEAPVDEKPSPTPSPTSEKPDAERDGSSTPADSDVMPDSPLQRCIAVSLDGQEVTFARTKKLTAVEVDPTCALPAGTFAPDDLPAMDDWDGAEFLPGLTTLTVTGFDGVTVPRDGLIDFATLESVSLAGNLLTELPDLGALPELTSLDLSDNTLTELSVPTAADVPQLTELDVRENEISDVSGASDAAAALTITATDQTLTHPDITARAPQQLNDVITVPDAWINPSWTPGENQMASVDGDAGTFSAARPGAWSLSWSLTEGKVSYSGSTTGDATAPEPEAISFTKPGPVAVGYSATYRADVSNLPTTVQSELEYQWYRGTSKSKLKPVDGATGQKFTIDSVSPEDDGTFVKLVATNDDVAHQSAPALLATEVEIGDDAFERCIKDELKISEISADDLAGLRRLDCSGRGIDDLDALQIIDPDGNVSIDLSNNLITEISRADFETDDGETRSKQLNLSDNQIVSVARLAGLDLSDAPASLVVLDGNSIRSVSILGSVELPASPGPAPISVRRQVVELPGVEVGGTSTKPTASSVTDPDLPLFRGNPETSVGNPVTYPDAGVEKLVWREDTSESVAFGGAFVVPVGDGPVLGFTFPTAKPTGGDTASVRGYGFGPGDSVTLSSAADEGLFGGGRTLVLIADAEGQLATTFTLGYGISGDQVVTATGNPSGLTATFEFILAEDKETVEVPDDALRDCISEEVGEPRDDNKFYGSQLDRITTDFSCRNKGVEDLTGLGEVPSPSIDLTSNDVASLDTVAPLSDATTSLNLTNNELEDLGDVEDQPRLRDLNLSQNQLRDLSDLDDVTFADDAEILAVGQTIRLRQRVVGGRTDVPTVTALRDQPAVLDFPDGQGSVGRDRQSIIWSGAGDQRIDFALRQAPRPDEEDDPEESEEAQRAPGLELAGSFLIRVVSAPPVVQPPSDPPAQQAPRSAAVQALAPRPLAERVEPEDDDRDSPRAVALGPEVALEEASPTPRTEVTNPTVEKRDPITSQAGWGLTATGWSLLGAALLAMALAVGIAVLTLGRSTR